MGTAWTRGAGAPKDPFKIVDTEGLNTAYGIVMQYQKAPGLLNPLFKKMILPYGYKVMAEKPKRMVDTGKLGEASGEGFCTYR